MTDDLVTRLKAEAEGAEFTNKYADLVAEAADRIDVNAATIARLEGEIKTLTTAGIIEVAVRNPSVSDYMQHWEARAEAAEAKVAAIREGDYFEGIEEGIKIGREAALREAAKMFGPIVRDAILALIQKGAADDRA